MIKCPNCKHQEMDGAIFCSECGARLVVHESLTTQTIHVEDAPPPIEITRPQRQQPPGAWATLHLLDSGRMLPLTDRTEYTLGRVSEGQPIMPDIDLSQYKAYENGVSRLHLVIKKTDDRVLVMDLGSANGSYLNGVRLSPNIDQPVNNGDILALGKLKIQVICNAT